MDRDEESNTYKCIMRLWVGGIECDNTEFD